MVWRNWHLACAALSILAVLGLGAGAAKAALISEIDTITVGDKRFSNFSCAATGPTASCDFIDVSGDFTSAGAPFLRFAGGLNDLSDPLGLANDWAISYDVTVLDPNQKIEQISLFFNPGLINPSSTTGAFASVVETVRDSTGNVIGNIEVSSTASSTDFNDPPFELGSPTDIPLSGPVSFASITKDIQLSGGVGEPGASIATISVVDQNFKQTRVPTPATLLFLGAGLLGLGAFARYHKGYKASV